MSKLAEPVWLSIEELAARLGRSPDTIRKWREDGYGPKGIRLGRRVAYHVDDVRSWEDQQREAVTA